MKKVLIIVDTSRNTGRQLLAGAEKYIRAFDRWQVHTKPPEYLEIEYEIADNLNRFDGFFICDAKNISRILETDKPKIINYIDEKNSPNAISIITDSAMIGKMAADYFYSLGFKHFAYCGFENIPWSEKRLQSYQLQVISYGFEKIYVYNDSSTYLDKKQPVIEWLKGLPKPICVFGCNDDRAIYIMEACKVAGISVPEEVAVLGVDNDELVCNLSSPPLSSILLNFETAGFIGAKLLGSSMRDKILDQNINVEPVEVIERQSTEVLAVEDKEVVSALIFIRNNFHKLIQARDVVEATTLSRRTLEYRFRTHLNRTIKQEIDRFRINYIKQSLAKTDFPVYQIAQSLDFTAAEHFSRYFKNLTGESPGEFRKRMSETE
ncbi:Xylose operon regulatory protein [Sedimentisphaera cyanobacteriorum]|uniref:Xylose operon regulatory protein n=1 Tax=Sedimentisphaera cyanobacteriorum TaxID=1940790 RepID=A0A1Q2HNP6_9BACT|nr:DNA-binding transcriptional regulator [Sedimentisphaera cyanobacteriorum]AQQ08980.1 Xylose operon regulatory protein [Sedimentisphaera cyanobacteriorum]